MSYIFSGIAAAAAAAMAIAGTGFQIYGQKKQADYQEDMSEYNQKLANMEAKEMSEAATRNAESKRADTRQLLARQRAVMAAGGADLSQGSPLEVLRQTAALGEKEQLYTLANDNAQADKMRQQAKMSGFEGAMARNQFGLQATGTALSGAAKVSSIWSDYYNRKSQYDYLNELKKKK